MGSEAEQNKIDRHPWYGPCDALADGECAECLNTIKELRSQVSDLVPFLALWAVRYSEDRGLKGLHPTHYDLMAKCGARMDAFSRAALARAEGQG